MSSPREDHALTETAPVFAALGDATRLEIVSRLTDGQARSIAQLTGKPADTVKDSLRRSRNLLIRDLPDLKLILNTAQSA